MQDITSARQTANQVWRLALNILLAVCAVALLLTVPTLYVASVSSARTARTAVADACAAEIRGLDDKPQAVVEGTLRSLRQRYGLRDVKLVSYEERTPLRPDRLQRPAGHQLLQIDFAEQSVPFSARTIRLLTMAAVVAALVSALLLLINLGAALRSASSPAGNRGNERTDLFSTLQTSIQTLKSRASEAEKESVRERERAAELEAVTATLVRSLNSGFIAVDAAGVIVDANATARELLGVPVGRAVTRQPIGAALGENEFTRVLDEAVTHHRSLQRIELTVSGESNDSATLGLSTVPLLDGTGRFLGMLALFTDLTPIRKLETRVREMQALADLGEISAGIAHEFRNSLAAVLGYLKLAARSVVPAESLERIHRAEREAQQLNGVVESLLAYARPMRLQLAPVDLLELLTALVERWRPLAERVTFTIEGSETTIAAEAPILMRAFENIIRNSIEAIDERGGPGIIAVRVEPKPVPVVTIADDGAGIRPESLPRLFLPFGSTKAGGTGLGLALTKKIVILHGGTIQLEGRAGGGAVATVEFALPQS